MSIWWQRREGSMGLRHRGGAVDAVSVQMLSLIERGLEGPGAVSNKAGRGLGRRGSGKLVWRVALITSGSGNAWNTAQWQVAVLRQGGVTQVLQRVI